MSHAVRLAAEKARRLNAKAWQSIFGYFLNLFWMFYLLWGIWTPEPRGVQKGPRFVDLLIKIPGPLNPVA